MTIRETNGSNETVEVLNGYRNEYLQNILRLERECFPADWQYSTAEEYYAAMLKDSENINIFLREDEGTVGYVLAKPYETAWLELKKYDPELRKASDKFYIETIQILPAYQGRGGARRLLIRACEEALKQGMTKFAIHARTSNGFHEKIKRIFDGRIILTRNIEKWKWAKDEPYEYIEWEYLPAKVVSTK